jgi:cell division protein FtsB
VAALIALVYFAFTSGRYVIHNYQLKHEEQRIRADIHQLARDHEELTAVRDYLESDAYVEYVARRILGLVRPGETLVVVSGIQPTPAADTTPEAGGTPGPWWKQLFAPQSGATPAPELPLAPR